MECYPMVATIFQLHLRWHIVINSLCSCTHPTEKGLQIGIYSVLNMVKVVLTSFLLEPRGITLHLTIRFPIIQINIQNTIKGPLVSDPLPLQCLVLTIALNRHY